MRITTLHMAGRSGTGIERQGRELTYHLSNNGMDIRIRSIHKREFNLFGKPRLGYASLIFGRCIPFKKARNEITHALDYSLIPFLSDPFDIVNVYDTIPWTNLKEYQSRMLESVLWASCAPGLNRARMIVVPSNHIASIARELFDRTNDGLKVINCGVDTDFWVPLRIGKDARSILVIGADYPRKNLLQIVKACGLLENATLRIVGNWRFENVRKAVYYEAKKSNVKIKYLGFINDIQLRQEYNRASVVCSASSDEGFGLTPIEGMACGTIAVVSDIPSHREVCGQAARYFNPSSPDEIAKGIDWGFNTTLGENKVRQQALQYSWQNVIPKWMALYHSLGA